MRPTDVLVIGVDGGATEVKAHAVTCDDLDHPTSFQLRPEAAARQYPRVVGFAPLPVVEQLAQRDTGKVQLSAAEVEQGGLWITAAAEAVGEVVKQCGGRRVLVGMGMPGLKTPDGRGIGVINNGPRMPAFLAEMERMLEERGVELVSAVAALGSDADYCGLGEEYAAEGLFRDVQSAYYVGGGTGIADAMKLRGRLVPFDAVKPWLMKAWQVPSALGPTFEKLVSASSINRIWDGIRGAEERRDEGATFPERAAVAGDPLAVAWLDTAALVLAELIFERLWTIKNGRPVASHRGDAYGKLTPDHEYRGLLLDRVVIGQRVGMLYAAPAYRGVFATKTDAYVAAFIASGGDRSMGAYLDERYGGTEARRHEGLAQALRPGFVRASKLRAAPALGAAVAAVRAASGQAR